MKICVGERPEICFELTEEEMKIIKETAARRNVRVKKLYIDPLTICFRLSSPMSREQIQRFARRIGASKIHEGEDEISFEVGKQPVTYYKDENMICVTDVGFEPTQSFEVNTEPKIKVLISTTNILRRVFDALKAEGLISEKTSAEIPVFTLAVGLDARTTRDVDEILMKHELRRKLNSPRIGYIDVYRVP